MPRIAADERLQRLLALVPWVASHDGPSVDEVCARFGCTEEELADDLELLFVCGLHPYTPDVLIEADIADGRVWIRYADYFARPLRLTPTEGLALLAAGKTLLAAPGGDPTGPLARGLDKLAAALGVDADQAVDIELGQAPGDVMTALRTAVEQHRQVELDYYSFGRDERTRRVVDPYAVFSAGGEWYLTAYCHQVDDERLFRVDRVHEATVLESTFAPRTGRRELDVYAARPDDPRVVLELEPAARWVLQQYPHEALEELGDGRCRVRLAVSERPWLERLLLRLGPDATVVEGDDSVAAVAARRLLGRYRTAPAGAL